MISMTKLLRFVISNYKAKHSDNRIHITFDHMFSHNNYTVFMISMRIGKQGIPLWFRCFKGKDDSDAFKLSLLKDGISYVSSLFDSSFNLIFLADRWFNDTSLMSHIDSLGHTFCIRLKKNIKVLVYDKKEGHMVWKFLDELFAYKYHSNLFNDIFLTENKFKVNIAISKTMDVKESWIIVTNGPANRAIKDYGYRFGSIECLFKNQKSNGFFMESVVKADIDYFTSMYSIICFASLFLTIVGADFSKNRRCYKQIKITTHKMFNENNRKIKKRVLSLFNVGLILFNMAFNSPKYIRIPFSFKLYDI